MGLNIIKNLQLINFCFFVNLNWTFQSLQKLIFTNNRHPVRINFLFFLNKRRAFSSRAMLVSILKLLKLKTGETVYF